ncbi:MAG: LysM peptidoglycan-binding domain-containing protein [Actinomycetales bacterium]|nr:LysM peptidoglycan-binding domain-containing protein [Actinomycetales bacterium]
MSMAAPFPTRQPAASVAHPMSVRSAAQAPVSRSTQAGPALRVVREPAPMRGRARLRLTRRGHIVLIAVSCLALFAVILGSGAVADAAVSLADEPATALVVVQPGDSIWSIAERIAAGQDPRAVVMRIQQLNGLGDWPIVPGQRLVVPA